MKLEIDVSEWIRKENLTIHEAEEKIKKQLNSISPIGKYFKIKIN
ncbi:hypothetical protein [Tenacibaculum aiptasiae]|nr:hypothetical protein [Tenacibaculum aiptasiae]